jgi:hypothetical protein
MLRWCALARLRSAAATPPACRNLSATPEPAAQQQQQEDALGAVLRAQLEAIRAGGTYKVERVITSPQSASVAVQGADREVLNFCAHLCGQGGAAASQRSAACWLQLAVRHAPPRLPMGSAAALTTPPPLLPAAGANNYLGLSNHPAVVQAAREALDSHGFGLSSVRFICGTQVGARGAGCVPALSSRDSPGVEGRRPGPAARLAGRVQRSPGAQRASTISTPAHHSYHGHHHKPPPTTIPYHHRAGPAQAAGGAHLELPRHTGHDPLPLLLRRQRRSVRGAADSGGRGHQRRAQPRVHHRRHPPVQGAAAAGGAGCRAPGAGGWRGLVWGQLLRCSSGDRSRAAGCAVAGRAAGPQPAPPPPPGRTAPRRCAAGPAAALPAPGHGRPGGAAEGGAGRAAAPGGHGRRVQHGRRHRAAARHLRAGAQVWRLRVRG